MENAPDPIDDVLDTPITETAADATNAEGAPADEAAQAEAPPADQSGAEKEDALVIDTTAEDEPLPDRVIVDDMPRRTFADVLKGETAAAFKSGDHTAHAALHNFEMAAGDFKRAAQLLAPVLPDGSELGQTVRAIISDL